MEIWGSAPSQGQDDKNDDDDEHDCSDTDKHGTTPFLEHPLAGGNCLIRGPRPGLAFLVPAQRLAGQAASHGRAGKGRYGSGGVPQTVPERAAWPECRAQRSR